MVQRLHRKAQQRIGSEHLPGVARAEVTLPDVRPIGADRRHQMHPIVDDQRHAGADQGRRNRASERDELVVAGQRVTQLHRGDPGRHRGRHRCGDPKAPHKAVSVTRYSERSGTPIVS